MQWRGSKASRRGKGGPDLWRGGSGWPPLPQDLRLSPYLRALPVTLFVTCLSVRLKVNIYTTPQDHHRVSMNFPCLMIVYVDLPCVRQSRLSRVPPLAPRALSYSANICHSVIPATRRLSRPLAWLHESPRCSKAIAFQLLHKTVSLFSRSMPGSYCNSFQYRSANSNP